MAKRIIGFDLARSYAIFGMFVVNFNTVFGSHTNHNGLSGFLNLFNGNSSSLFVILAGMGMALMTNKDCYTSEEKRKIKTVINKRSWFLFIVGILFTLWWPADILHFYGGYMHIALLLIFAPKKYYLMAAATAILVFHSLLLIVPYTVGWNFETLQYTDFWTIKGFLRNTFYNGWNSIFPWIAYFLFGMYLGRLNWNDKRIIKRIFITGFLIYSFILLLQNFAYLFTSNADLLFYIQADYIPPFVPFMLSTMGFGCMSLCFFTIVGDKIKHSFAAKLLISTGQLTLTHYVAHMFIGFYSMSIITGKTLSYTMMNEVPTHPLVILIFAIIYFGLSSLFSYQWLKKFKNGPLETIMRKVSD